MGLISRVSSRTYRKIMSDSNQKPLIIKSSRLISAKKFEIKIGNGCVIHPEAEINALNGPIIIGERNIIEERAKIINENAEPLIVGNDNVFEVQCDCRAAKVGSNCIIGTQSKISSTVTISNGVTLAMRSKINPKSPVTIPTNTSIRGENSEHWRTVKHVQLPTQVHQIDYLKGALP